MKILVIAPHADDETLGAGGTIARHARAGDEVVVAVMTGHGDEAPHPLWERDVWTRVRAEAERAAEVLGVRELVFEEIPAVQVADQPLWKLNRLTEAMISRFAPEILYVPFPLDLHRDHRELFHSLSVAWRPSASTGRDIRAIYCYEVPSETHWNIPYVEQGFLPTHWVDISTTLETKLEAAGCYASQIQEAPAARSLAAARALAVWRGSQIGVAAAEAFVTVRTLG